MYKKKESGFYILLLLGNFNIQTTQVRWEILCIYVDCLASAKSKQASSVLEPIEDTAEDSIILVCDPSFPIGVVISKLTHVLEFIPFVRVLTKTFLLVIFELTLVDIIFCLQFTPPLKFVPLESANIVLILAPTIVALTWLNSNR